MPNVDSIAAIATPVAPSALGIIRCSGPLSSSIFLNLEPRRATLRKYTSLSGELLDQVVVTFYESGKSFTGEDSLELTCHGNPFILQKILADLLARGFRLAEPGEFTRRAFLNGQIDLTQAEAIGELIAARSDRALAAAHKQLGGELGRALKGFSDELIALIAAVEASLSFSEHDEDVPRELPSLERFQTIAESLSKLRRTHYAHTLTFEGARIALIGKPNAGKSSLFNILVGHERALVSPIAGTTRDYISANIQLGGHLVTLIDTAGLNPLAEKDSIESLGIKKSQDQLATADLVLQVFDATLPFLDENTSIDTTKDKSKIILVANKSDLSNFKLPQNSIAISCAQNTGMDLLKEKIINHLDALMPAADTLMVSARHAASLNECLLQLQMAAELLQKKSDPALIAHHLHSSLHHLGHILGRFDNEQILDSLFHQFCIGK